MQKNNKKIINNECCINAKYKLLYKNAIQFDAVPKHLIPTREEWSQDKDNYLLIYKCYLEHVNQFDSKIINDILVKNHFFEYINFLKEIY